MSIVISDTPDLFNERRFDVYEHGQLFIVLPQLAKAVGPISTPDYLAHLVKRVPHPELAAVEAARVRKSSLPPCR